MPEKTLHYYLIRCKTCGEQIRLVAYNSDQALIQLMFQYNCSAGSHVAFPNLYKHVDPSTLKEVPYNEYLMRGVHYHPKPRMRKAIEELFLGTTTKEDFIANEVEARKN